MPLLGGTTARMRSPSRHTRKSGTRRTERANWLGKRPNTITSTLCCNVSRLFSGALGVVIAHTLLRFSGTTGIPQPRRGSSALTSGKVVQGCVWSWPSARFCVRTVTRSNTTGRRNDRHRTYSRNTYHDSWWNRDRVLHSAEEDVQDSIRRGGMDRSPIGN